MKQQSHSRLPSSQDFDHLVYLRVFEGCNLHCKHCFIPSNPKRMTSEAVSSVPALLKGRIAEGSKILLQWHGGEPTLMGEEFIRSSIESLHSSETYHWRHGIQTNLMTFDEEWARLYHDHFGSEVGISWDPKIRLLNKHALDSHPEFDKRFDTRLQRLIEADLTPYLVVTAAKTLFDAFPNPFDFFDRWQERGVRHVHLERITQTGYARDNWKDVGLSNNEYSSYMSKWLKAYTVYKRNALNADFFLSPFEDMQQSILSLQTETPSGHGCWSGKCDTRFHTIDAHGYKAGCTALTSEIGNKNATAAPIISNDLPMKRELRTYNCSACKFRKICSSGCLALNFDDGSGECSGGSKLFQTALDLNQNGV
jgi:radical SAM protein with 4Fe4S-binding SPASM domain